MIYSSYGETVLLEGKKFTLGERIIATDSDYAGLKGQIFEIRTGSDKETENETDDIYCSFDIPEKKEEIKLLEEHFSQLYGEKKTIDDISLDLVIMAPDEIRRLDENG